MGSWWEGKRTDRLMCVSSVAFVDRKYTVRRTHLQFLSQSGTKRRWQMFAAILIGPLGGDVSFHRRKVKNWTSQMNTSGYLGSLYGGLYTKKIVFFITGSKVYSNSPSHLLLSVTMSVSCVRASNMRTTCDTHTHTHGDRWKQVAVVMGDGRWAEVMDGGW